MGNRQSHEQRHSSFASFVVTSTSTNPNEELENYICSMNESSDGSVISPVHIQFESFMSPIINHTNANINNTNSARSQYIPPRTNEHLMIYAVPVIQMQLSSQSKETMERIKEIKKEKSILLAIINPTNPAVKVPVKQNNDDQQQSDKKILNQISDLMKRKHQLRLIELEESVLLAQQDMLKSNRSPMNSNTTENDPDSQRRNTKNIKDLWRDAVRALTTPASTSGSTENENRSSFVRRISSRKKKQHHEHEEDQTVIDPVYETLKVAAETRKRTIANYLQQRQQSLNKQTSLNSQGSSEPETQSSPKAARSHDTSSSTRPKPSSTSDTARISNY